MKDGASPVDLAENTATITILFFENECAIYIDKTPIYYHDFYNADRSQLSRFNITVQEGSDETQGNMVEFDNLKIWDLDKIETLSTTTQLGK